MHDILLSPMCILGHRTSRPRLTYYVCWAPSVLHGSVGPGKQAQSLTPACISTDLSVCLPDLPKSLYMILDAMRRIGEVLEAWRRWGSALVSHIPFSPSDAF